MTEEALPAYRRYLARTLVGLVVPQGYTLSVSGALVVAVHRFGLGDWLQARAATPSSSQPFSGLCRLQLRKV